MIVVNNQVAAQESRFSPDDVKVFTTTVDLEEVGAFLLCSE